MENYAFPIWGVGVVGVILLTMLVGKGIDILFEKAKDRGIEIPLIAAPIIWGITLLLCVSCCFFLLIGVQEWIDSRMPAPQTIIVMNRAGEVIAEYENAGDDLSYTCDRNGKIEITSGGKHYIYLDATVEIILEDSEQ